MSDDKFGKTCPVCAKRITPAFLARHIGQKHPQQEQAYKDFLEDRKAINEAAKKLAENKK